MNEISTLNHLVEVTMSISSKVRKIDGVLHLKWEPNVVKVIEVYTIKFFALDMKTAMERVNYMVGVHPKDYFCNIKFKNQDANNY